MDVGCYCVSAARLVAGEPVHVRAEQIVGGDGVDVRLAATMRFAGDVLGVIDCALDAPIGHRLTRRRRGRRAGPRGPVPRRATRASCTTGSLVEVPYANPYALEFENFSAAIRGEAEPLLGRPGRPSPRLPAIEALYRSAEAT